MRRPRVIILGIGPLLSFLGLLLVRLHRGIIQLGLGHWRELRLEDVAVRPVWEVRMAGPLIVNSLGPFDALIDLSKALVGVTVRAIREVRMRGPLVIDGLRPPLALSDLAESLVCVAIRTVREVGMASPLVIDFLRPFVVVLRFDRAGLHAHNRSRCYGYRQLAEHFDFYNDLYR